MLLCTVSITCIYRANSYCPDVRGRRSGNIMPEWKKIVLGYNNNNEEMLQDKFLGNCSYEWSGY
jgi:hypothetical protein